MAIKTFTTGEVLTAADTNSYLANSGLVFVKSQTFNAASFQITSIFSATYTNYRILVNIDTHGGGAANVTARMLNGTTPYTTAQYCWVGSEQAYTGGPFTTFGLNNATQWTVGRIDGDGGAASMVVEVLNPFVARRSMFNNEYVDNTQNGQTGGILKNTTSFNGMDFTAPATIAGTAIVYGYRTS